MAYFLSPVLNEQQFDANGVPLAFGSILTYLANTTTLTTTYKTSTGTAHTNPIVLDAAGYYPTGTQLWLEGGRAYRFVIQNSLGATIRTIENIVGIGDSSAPLTVFFPSGLTPTYISATSFSMVGDQTLTFPPGLRIQTVNTGGTITSTVARSVFSGGITTLTIVNDSGVLDAGLSQVSYSIISPVNNPLPAPNIPGYLFGCTMSTAGTSITMNIAAGIAMPIQALGVPMNLSAIAKTNVAWAVGTAVGGLDTGAIAPNAGYHFFVIRRPDTGVVDALYSLSATAPTLPANYTQFRRIGWGRTNGSNQWISFVQDGDYFQWAAPTVDFNQVSSGTAAVLRTLTVPIGVSVRTVLNLLLSAGGGGDSVYVSDPAVTDLPSSSGAVSPICTMFAGASVTVAAQVMTRTNTSGQIRTRQGVGGATETLRGATVGWYDDRGRTA